MKDHPVRLTEHDRRWLDTYEELKEFRRIYGSMPVDMDGRAPEERRLGRWLTNQVYRVRNPRPGLSPVPAWRVRALRKIGAFGEHRLRLAPETRLGDWADTLGEVLRWVVTFGALPNEDSTTERGQFLGRWITKQRTLVRRGAIRWGEQVELLASAQILFPTMTSPGVYLCVRDWNRRRGRVGTLGLAAQAAWMWAEGMQVAEVLDRLGCSEKRWAQIVEVLQIDPREHQARDQLAPHGHPGRWMAGCRCAVCVKGRRAYKAADLERSRARATPETIRHGTTRGYQLGCRCDQCRAALLAETRGRQEETRSGAKQHAKPWTPAQVWIASDLTRSIREAAAATGRTYAAVSNVRAALADEKRSAHAKYQGLLDEYKALHSEES